MRQKLLFLDGIRGLAALYVVVHHARWVLWEGYHEGYLKHPDLYTSLQKGLMYFFSMFRYGHEAVLLFFVLSGFVIHLRYSKQLAKSGVVNFNFKDFFFRRARRIVPPLLLAIVITFCLDLIGIYFELPIYSKAVNYSSIAENLHTDHSIKTLAGNLFFLMKIYVPVWGTNGPLWSLAYEWWFYMLYPFFLFLSIKNVWFPLIALSLLSLMGFYNVFHFELLDKVLSLMIIWWMGAFLTDIYTERIKLKFTFLSPLALLIPLKLVLSVFAPEVHFSGFLYYIMWGLGFTGVFAFFFSLNSNLNFLNKLKPLGDISYSLYILHMPGLTLFSAVLMDFHSESLLPKGFSYVFIGIFISLALGYLGYILVEKPVLNYYNGRKLDLQPSGRTRSL